MNTLKIKVGTLTLTESRDQSLPQEFAAWHQTVRIEPGTYDVFAYIEWAGGREGGYRLHQLSAQCEGVTVSSNFRSHLWGQWGKSDNNRNGEREIAHVHLPTYGQVGEKSLLAQATLCDAIERVERVDADGARRYSLDWNAATKPIVIEQARHSGGLSLAALQDDRRFTVDAIEMSPADVKKLDLSFHGHSVRYADQLTVGESAKAYSYADRKDHEVTRLA
jgi:hypothetical protein